ncbi:MAG TPA: YCF48-related protein [Pyrinomonadaceae bacterium]|nr:YCF48-related protein [Pyrinomonadaceae bacterium]
MLELWLSHFSGFGLQVYKMRRTINHLLAVTLFMIGAANVATAQWVATRLAGADQDLNTVFFLDSKRGWIGGDNGFLSRTDDGGQTWIRQAVGFTDGINDIYFRDKEDGFLLAGNAIFVSRDSGSRWTESRRFQPTEFDGALVELYSVRFPSKKKGWVVGSVSKRDRVIDSILISTTDGGDTWQRQRAPSRLELIHLDFDNDRRGWIVGAGGTILKTTDGGLTWTKQNSQTTATIYHVNFRNDKRGWAVGERGTILRTTDGGDQWETVNAGVRSTLLSIQFLGDDDGWAVGRGGTVLRTGDGGRSWVQQEAATKENLYALYFNKKIGWAVGGEGTILRYEK